jgi:RNA-directed DNA polymerase
LCVSRASLDRLLAKKDNYVRFQHRGRQIQDPKPLLKKIHARVALLLARIETPDYLHSAIKGRSYITNAATHRELTSTVKLDVKKFYPSARAQAVFHFFLDRLHCARDVAGILTKLLTVDGCLPTGGNASPILSFWAYRANVR